MKNKILNSLNLNLCKLETIGCVHTVISDVLYRMGEKGGRVDKLIEEVSAAKVSIK